MPDLAVLKLSPPKAELTLNRPDARNALSLELLEALHTRLDELAPRTDIIALTLRGEGKAFCAGMDLKQVMGTPAAGSGTPPSQGGAGVGSPDRTPSTHRDIDWLSPARVAALAAPPVGEIRTLPRDPVATERAQTLRRAATGPERALWSALSGHGLGGLKFRRQHPYGPYILDFVCLEAGLVVELDGQTHGSARAREHDSRRTEFLRAHGFHVIRFTDDQAVSDLESVCLQVLDVASLRLGRPFPAHLRHLARAAGSTPPSQGGAGVGSPASPAHNPTHPQPLPLGGEPISPALHLLTSLARFTLRLRRLPIVTIARVQGAAIGGGCGLACVTDFCLTHGDSKMGFPEVDLGVCPAVVAPWLVRKIGAGRARAILLQGGLMSGRSARDAGIADRCVDSPGDLDSAVHELENRLAEGGPMALRATKALLNEIDGSLDDAVVLRGAEISAAVLATPEAQERLRAKVS